MRDLEIAANRRFDIATRVKRERIIAAKKLNCIKLHGGTIMSLNNARVMRRSRPAFNPIFRKRIIIVSL